MPSVSRYFNIISRCAGIYRAERFKKIDLGQNHHSYLLCLSRHPGISQDELSHLIYINKSNVTRHLARLEQQGYVVRKQSEEDKRVILVYPTEKVEEVLPQIRASLKEWNDIVLEDFSEEEKEILLGFLKRIKEKATGLVEKQDLGEE